VAARLLANPESRVCAVVGCGPINRSCLTAIAGQLDRLDTVICHDLSADAAQNLADWSVAELGVKARVALDLRDALSVADVVTVAASRIKPLHVEADWFKPGSTVLISGPLNGDEAFWTRSIIVYDHGALHAAYMRDARTSPDKNEAYAALIGGPLYRLIDAGRLPPLTESASLGDVLRGVRAGRSTTDERVVFVASGMPVFDLGWGFEIYERAKANNVGRWLQLWDSPYLA
jgi:N-[(2S)-2-amino-2-carboxyethyl]-L-glutamate dehydrogenase